MFCQTVYVILHGWVTLTLPLYVTDQGTTQLLQQGRLCIPKKNTVRAISTSKTPNGKALTARHEYVIPMLGTVKTPFTYERAGQGCHKGLSKKVSALNHF